jgi:hypothetical protein
VVSTITFEKSEGFAAPVLVATDRFSWIKAARLSSPILWRQRVIDERWNKSVCWKSSSPQNSWKQGFSSQRAQSASSERSRMCLRIANPAISLVGSGGWPAASE